MDATPEGPTAEEADTGALSEKSAWKKLSSRSRWLLVLAAIVVVSVVVAAITVPRYLDSRPTDDAAETTEPPESSIDPSLDSDGDGIPDVLEISGWRVLGGTSYITDPKNPDTDGDGLSDGKEAGEPQPSDSDEVIYAGISDPTKIDSDDDGLTDKAEVRGWSTEGGDQFFTDPLNPDTDGDGLFDGDEAGDRVSGDGEDDLYSGFSNPSLADTDGDGLSDAEEADNGTNPALVDTDGDGLDDLQEVQVVGTDPNRSDTDGDGHSDAYEEENREELGLDPLFEDVEVSAWEYAGDFAKGALAGDAWRADSLAWLAGNLVSSGSSFIPGFGWIIGGVADARDTIANAIQADWVGAGFSAIGLIPYVGDAAAIPKKAASFVVRNPELAAAAGALVVALNKVPESIKVDASKQIWKEWDTLKNAGANDKALLQLQQSGRINLDSLGTAMRRDGHVAGPSTRFLKDGNSGEATQYQALTAAGMKVETQVRMPTDSCIEVCNATVRIIDNLADGVAYESKVGFKVLNEEIMAQINSDAYLIKTGAIKSAHWDFYPSAHTNQVGASKPVLDLLEANGITFTIHMPKTR